MNKLKIVWICHFSNSKVRSSLPLAQKGKLISDYSPWITNMIQEFKNIKEVEIHIISPHLGLKKIIYSYENENIYYNFFKADIPFLNRYWPAFFKLDAFTGFIRNRMIVKYLLKKIKPDLINLIGAENSYYSTTILGINNIPKLVSIQGIYSNPLRFTLEKKDRTRCFYERKIHKENKYYGISAPFMPELIKRDYKEPILLWNRFPRKIVSSEIKIEKEKEYDFVFFSRITYVKGPEDALKALAIVKEYYQNVKMLMMGPPGTKTILDELKYKAKLLGIDRNIKIHGGFTLQEDMLKQAAKCKYYVLPAKIDTIPNTIFEAIDLGLPILSYNTGDIPLLNTGDTRILLCDKGDYKSLANNMITLLKNPDLGMELSKKAKIFIDKYFNNKNIALNMVSQYHAVLENYYNNIPIPKHLLYENYIINNYKI